MSQPYFGAYEAFDTVSKSEGSALVGADNIIGDEYTIELVLEEGVHKAWLVNRFAERIGFFNPGFSRRLSVMAAEGLKLRAVLAFVAYSNEPEPGHYWGEAAVIAYSPADAEAYEKFISHVGNRMAEGVRVKVDLGAEGARRIVESGGEWIPKQTTALPPKRKGAVIMKSQRSLTDKIVEAGRARNAGCYVGSWLFIIAVVALIAWGVYALFFASNA